RIVPDHLAQVVDVYEYGILGAGDVNGGVAAIFEEEYFILRLSVGGPEGGVAVAHHSGVTDGSGAWNTTVARQIADRSISEQGIGAIIIDVIIVIIDVIA